MSREGLCLPPFSEFGFLKQAYQRKGRLGSKPRHRLGDTQSCCLFPFWNKMNVAKGGGVFRSPLRTLIFYARERLSSVGKNDWCASMRICACSPKPIQKANHYSVCNPRAREEERRWKSAWGLLTRSGEIWVQWEIDYKVESNWERHSRLTAGLHTHVYPWADTHAHTHWRCRVLPLGSRICIIQPTFSELKSVPFWSSVSSEYQRNSN